MAEEEKIWRRIAVKPKTGKMLDVLLVMANAYRPANAQLTLYELVGQIVRVEWAKMRERGVVTDAMLGEWAETASDEPVYTPAETGA